MKSMPQDVVVDVISQVTSNVAASIAQHLSAIVAKKLNDKFIIELRTLEEQGKK